MGVDWRSLVLRELRFILLFDLIFFATIAVRVAACIGARFVPGSLGDNLLVLGLIADKELTIVMGRVVEGVLEL